MSRTEIENQIKNSSLKLIMEMSLALKNNSVKKSFSPQDDKIFSQLVTELEANFYSFKRSDDLKKPFSPLRSLVYEYLFRYLRKQILFNQATKESLKLLAARTLSFPMNEVYELKKENELLKSEIESIKKVLSKLESTQSKNRRYINRI